MPHANQQTGGPFVHVKAACLAWAGRLFVPDAVCGCAVRQLTLRHNANGDVRRIVPLNRFADRAAVIHDRPEPVGPVHL